MEGRAGSTDILLKENSPYKDIFRFSAPKIEHGREFVPATFGCGICGLVVECPVTMHRVQKIVFERKLKAALVQYILQGRIHIILECGPVADSIQ